MTAITDPSTCAWVCAHHGQRVRQLFAALNLELPALAAVRAAVAAEDWERAGAALLDYYRAGDSGQWLRHDPVPPGEGTDPDAERMARACFPVPGGEVQLPRLPSGNFDWGHVPPVVGGIEWSCGVNRHDYMADLLRAFYATGNRAYVRALTEQVHDWCATVAEPDPIDRHDGSSPWGTILEVGHRAKAWPAVFYGLQPEAAFTPAARLLLLCRALDHAQFLRRHHAGGSNWIITEMCGLLSIACAFPELRDAGEWRDLALRLTQEELAGQLYPDGVQKELASNYQLAVLWHMDFFVATVRGAGMPADPALSALLEAMWNYLAYALSPNGYAPHNSDSDRPLSDASQAIKPLLARGPILAAADAYDRPDWRYIATNGEEGARPPRSPSVLFPWAGQLIMRSGWEAEAQWGFFDLGPWGILHQHNDMLHLSVTAGGRDLLVDSGRYTYQHYMGEAGTWRSYFIGSAAHNVICVDGLEQTNGPALAARPVEAVITPAYDYAQGTYAGGFTDVATAAARHKAYLYRWELPRDAVREDITHTRGVLYLRGVGWVVVDRVTLMQPRRVTPLWHFHPDCTVACEAQSVVTVDAGVGNLRIQPVAPFEWEIELVRGREGPDFQGWYSPEMDVRLPNTCAIYAANLPRTATFAWLLLPGNGAVPACSVTAYDAPEGAVHLRLDIPGQAPLEIAVRLDEALPLRLTSGEMLTAPCAVRPAEGR